MVLLQYRHDIWGEVYVANDGQLVNGREDAKRFADVEEAKTFAGSYEHLSRAWTYQHVRAVEE